MSEEQFASARWQSTHCVRSLDQLREAVGAVVDPAFLADVRAGLAAAPMALRLTPYVMSLIDWRDPARDPIRRQFIPLGSERRPDHPAQPPDPLQEQADAPVPGLVHRYRDRALLLATHTCPVYCRYCTRAYAVGPEPEGHDDRSAPPIKLDLATGRDALDLPLRYLEDHPQIEDVVISGGDAYHLPAAQLDRLGRRLLQIPHVRRLRVATRGPAVLPQQLLGDAPWFEALVGLVHQGRQRGKPVYLHTHFNHPAEITALTRRAMARLFEAGVTTRNQSVLLRGVNDDLLTLRALVRTLARLNVEPYYVYLHDMVPGLEALRTPLHAALRLEKEIRGDVAGFFVPTFVVDTTGGGGKRDAHSFEVYDRTLGVALYRAPAVKPGAFYFFDPLDSLPEPGRERWSDPAQHSAILAEVFARAP